MFMLSEGRGHLAERLDQVIGSGGGGGPNGGG
jgi:hypothetical protein